MVRDGVRKTLNTVQKCYNASHSAAQALHASIRPPNQRDRIERKSAKRITARATSDDPKSLANDDVLTTVYAASLKGKRTFIAGNEVRNGDRAWQGIAIARRPKGAKVGKLLSLCNLRINDIERAIKGDHGGPCATDDGIVYYELALVYMVARRAANASADKPLNSIEWARLWVPRLVDEYGEAWFLDREASVLSVRRIAEGGIPTSEETARILRLTNAKRLAFGIKSTCAIDRNSKQLASDQKERDRLGKKAKRAAQGSTSRENSDKARHARGEFIEMFGDVSLRTVERRLDELAQAAIRADEQAVHVSSVPVVVFSAGQIHRGENPLGTGQATGETPIGGSLALTGDSLLGSQLHSWEDLQEAA